MAKVVCVLYEDPVDGYPKISHIASSNGMGPEAASKVGASRPNSA